MTIITITGGYFKLKKGEIPIYYGELHLLLTEIMN